MTAALASEKGVELMRGRKNAGIVNMQQDLKVCVWEHRTIGLEESLVYPDGCRDILIIREKYADPRILLTQFDFRPRVARLNAGTHISGYRLPPGRSMQHGALLSIIHEGAVSIDRIESGLTASDDIDEAIFELSQINASVETVATNLGVSIRTMQRRFKARDLPPPEYWRLLARSRRAAALLSEDHTISEIAFEMGFSDQSHMTREFMRWFGTTPDKLRRDRRLMSLINQPALAT